MHPRAPRRHRGVTLIEVLVAILVLSIGLLGIAATLAKSHRYALGAWSQGAVADGMADIAERLRSSPNASSADFTIDDDYATQRSELDAGSVTVARDCSSNSCTAAQTAAFHIAQWRLSLDRSLPGSAAWVRPLSNATSSAQATSFEVAVMWFDKANLDSSGALNAALVCTGSETGLEQRRCCPSAASPADGVRCTRVVLVP